MPDGVVALEKLGITFKPEECHPFEGVRFFAGGSAADAPFPANSGLGVRRTTLHRVMIERAASLGIELLWRAPVTGISREAVSLGNRKVNAKWIIGADGANSRVRRWARLDRFRKRNSRYAFRQHYHLAPWTDRMEVYWGRDSQIYVAPVTEEQMCVVLVSHDSRLRLEEALKAFPELQTRLRGAEIASGERGTLTATCNLKRVRSANVALIGDASGTVDAITGDGLSLSFSQALVLGESLASGDLARYEDEHRQLARRPLLMSRLMLTLDGRPRLQHRIVQAFRKRPEIFRRLLALHVGALSPLRVAADGLTLGWGLLTA